MSPKDLISLAKTCRKAGIKHYKSEEVEFTLTDESPISQYKKRLNKKSLNPETLQLVADQIESDGWENLSLEQKLNWSSDSLIEEEINS